MTTMVVPATTGVVISTLDHAGGLPAIDRIIRETGLAHAYRHSGAGPSNGLGAVQVTLAGCGRLWPDGCTSNAGIALPPGRCLAFQYGQPVAYTTDSGAPRWDFIYINLHGTAALAMLGELTAQHGHALACDLAHPAMLRIVDLSRGPGIRHRHLTPADSARIASDVLLALAQANPCSAEPDRDALEAACDYLIHRISQPVDIADAARSVGFSREHLTRLFRRRLGIAPAAWLRRERLLQADLLLRSGMRPLAAIAQRCGFATTSHFVHAFRKRFGTTPGQLRGGQREN